MIRHLVVGVCRIDCGDRSPDDRDPMKDGGIIQMVGGINGHGVSFVDSQSVEARPDAEDVVFQLVKVQRLS